eukprot:1153022-Pelagomonas_calceolata.AAC.7
MKFYHSTFSSHHHFLSSRRLRLQPTPSVAQNQERLNHWLHLFKTHNPSMNDAGVGEVELPANGPVGTIEYLLMDENEQVGANCANGVLVRNHGLLSDEDEQVGAGCSDSLLESMRCSLALWPQGKGGTLALKSRKSPPSPALVKLIQAGCAIREATLLQKVCTTASFPNGPDCACCKGSDI